jgi:hypothetical protein
VSGPHGCARGSGDASALWTRDDVDEGPWVATQRCGALPIGRAPPKHPQWRRRRGHIVREPRLRQCATGHAQRGRHRHHRSLRLTHQQHSGRWLPIPRRTHRPLVWLRGQHSRRTRRQDFLRAGVKASIGHRPSIGNQHTRTPDSEAGWSLAATKPPAKAPADAHQRKWACPRKSPRPAHRTTFVRLARARRVDVVRGASGDELLDRTGRSRGQVERRASAKPPDGAARVTKVPVDWLAKR